MNDNPNAHPHAELTAQYAQRRAHFHAWTNLAAQDPAQRQLAGVQPHGHS